MSGRRDRVFSYRPAIEWGRCEVSGRKGLEGGRRGAGQRLYVATFRNSILLARPRTAKTGLSTGRPAREVVRCDVEQLSE